MSALLRHEQVCLMFNERYSWEILLPWLNMFICDKFIVLQTLNTQYIPYISVTHKVFKSCRSKMATSAHDICDVHGSFSLMAKFIQGFPYWGVGESPTNQQFAHSPPPHQIFIPSHQKSIQPNKKIKMSFLAVVIAPVPFLF